MTPAFLFKSARSERMKSMISASVLSEQEHRLYSSPRQGQPVHVHCVVGVGSSSCESEQECDKEASSSLWVTAPAAGYAESERLAWKMRLDMLRRGKHKSYKVYTWFKNLVRAR